MNDANKNPWSGEFLRASVIIATILVAIAPAEARAAEPKPEPAKPGEAHVQLRHIVMFRSGVGYFEHQGTVEGDANVTLKFTVEQINDLLKSMVVQDLGGGQIEAVTYGSRAPLERLLKTFAIDLTKNVSLADLLQQVRGEKVQVEAPNPVTGTIISIETQKQPVDDKKVVDVHLLNLDTPQGLKGIPLNSIHSIKLLNPQTQAELQQALNVLAGSHDNQQRSVTLDLRGKGKRDVRVGYVRETAVWKVTYRLDLQQGGDCTLQGWAIVENTTDHDWHDVRLSLVSGRPISFVMPLYQPLFVDRPEVELPVYQSLRPQTYEQALEKRKQAPADEMKAAQAPAADRNAMRAQAAGRGFGAGAGLASQDAAKRELELLEGVKARAQAGEVGELFKYSIESPVTLARQKSAMLPILNAKIKCEKVSIYDQSVDPKHPLHGIRLTNTSKLYLMQGPITVFEGGTYAGDAILNGLAQGQDGLISYAVDLGVEVAPETKSHPQHLVEVRIDHGTLHATHKQMREHTYLITNSGDKAQMVLIQYPKTPDWNLVSPEKPAATTRDSYRFRVEVKPNASDRLVVKEERTIGQQMALTNLGHDQVMIYINSAAISDRVKHALREVATRKQEIVQVSDQLQGIQQHLKSIREEQERIRQNMAQLDRNTQLYSRYVKELSQQEDQIGKLRDRLQQLQREKDQKQKGLNDYLQGLTLKPQEK